MKPSINSPPPRKPVQSNVRRAQPPGVVQRKTVAPWIRETPAAPPRYSPQPVPKVLQRKKAVATPPPPIARGGGTVQRMIRSPFDMPDIFEDLRASLPLPPMPVVPTATPVAVPLTPVPSLVSVPPSVPLSPKPQEQKKPPEGKGRRQKFKPLVFSRAKDDTDLFNSLGAAGELPSNQITFSQLRCGVKFKTKFNLDGQDIIFVGDLTEKLKQKPQLYTQTPAIKITLYEGRIMSVDNRRLKAHRDAGAKICFIKVAFEDLTANDKSHIDDQAPAENCNTT